MSELLQATDFLVTSSHAGIHCCGDPMLFINRWSGKLQRSHGRQVQARLCAGLIEPIELSPSFPAGEEPTDEA